MKDHRRLIPLTLPTPIPRHSPDLRPIHSHNFDALCLQLLLHSRPCLTGVETHRHVPDHVGFESRTRDVRGRVRDAIVARGADAEYMRDVCGSQLVA